MQTAAVLQTSAVLGAGKGLCDQALAMESPIKTRYGFICPILQSFYGCALQEQQALVW